MKFYTNEEIIEKKIKKTKIFEMIKLILVILISIVILYNIVLIIEAIVNPNQTPSIFGYKTFSIISGSMKPSIDVGDIVIVKKTELKKEDIITYRKNDEMITHRIIDIYEEDGENRYITKGDNNNIQDEEYVIEKYIEGKVIKIIPKLGHVIIFLQNKLVIFIILIIFVLSYINDMKKNNKKLVRRQKREIMKEKETKG